MLNLSVLLEDSARSYPNREAVVLGPTRLTYGQVDAAANQVANLLVSRGVKPGDKVALTCPNLPWFPIVYHGILKAGAVVVPLNVLLKAREVAYHLRDSDARAYFCFEGTPGLPAGVEGHAGFKQADGCEHFFTITAEPGPASRVQDTETLSAALAGLDPSHEPVATQATDTAVILYTSGTTGQPKGAELTHANLLLNALTVHRFIGGEGTDRHLATLPLFHSFGQTVQLHTAFAGGNTVVLMPRFDPAQAIELLQSEAITHFAGVPTMYHALLSALTGDADVVRIAGSLRFALCGGASMPVELLREVEQKLGVKVFEGYGLSETSPAVCFTPDTGEYRPGSIGKPLWGVEMKLIDRDWSELPDDPDTVGEIAIKGHPVMKGYHNRPEATAEAINNGWFRTGDLARRDADGHYYIAGRAKEVIIRGGYNIYPRELEEVLMAHPAVSLVAVIGVPHKTLGEEVKAIVQRTPGDQTTEEELLAWGKAQFAAYKYPRIVEFRDSLPMNATGKILKRELTE